MAYKRQPPLVLDIALDGSSPTATALVDEVPDADSDFGALAYTGTRGLSPCPAVLPGPPILSSYTDSVDGVEHRFVTVTLASGKNGYRYVKDLGRSADIPAIDLQAGEWMLTGEGYLLFSAQDKVYAFLFSVDDLSAGAQSQTAYFS